MLDLQESRIDWSQFLAKNEIVLEPKKKPRQHQLEARDAVREGLQDADRGKIIMACGTGKTFTGLIIAEELAGKGKIVLFLVPSLALMAQTVTKWKADCSEDFIAFAVCSDTQVGKRSKYENDVADIQRHDLAFPATTDARKLAEKVALPIYADDEMKVVFATYQSIQVIADAQAKYGLPEFDLVICDEAHRTTGATLADEDDSNFVKIHDSQVVRAKKRLYMTATPRIFGDAVKVKANEANAVLASMDDASLFGEVLFERGFSWAVENELLCDYKVIVLAVDEDVVSRSVQRRLADGASELKLDDATRIVGCYKALAKQGLHADQATDLDPMHRALAFCRDIRSSKLIENEFAQVVDEYLAEQGEADSDSHDRTPLCCEIQHVDGTFNARERGKALDWLTADADHDVCRVLTNARCLSEGVDVPALDAILFLHPRKSQIDVVQSVGRVMRTAPGKKRGYVILPVGIPSGVPPEQALNDNEKYRVVWQILNALRAHDDRFDATINMASLGEDISAKIEIVAVVDQLPDRDDLGSGLDLGGKGGAEGQEAPTSPTLPPQIELFVDEFSKAIMAKIVKKCGTRDYWDKWAHDIGRIAQHHVSRIKAIVEKPGTPEHQAFSDFLVELRDDLNPSLQAGEAIEMLSQHIITKPVFETLFEGYDFTEENPVSKAMQAVLDQLHESNVEKEADSLEEFYASVRRRATGILTAQGKQRLIVELYDDFFKRAFPKMTERLGIVYTPVEVVDFIIRSVNDVLKQEFGQTLGSKGVHIIDPFTGTGTFITRLLQSGLITLDEVEHKYHHEIHANEIVLLAYYIAAINIEAAYHGLMANDYLPFNGICLTDTFQMYESDDLVDKLMPDNSERRRRQKELDLQVIIGNPPYSVGQRSANDDNANLSYSSLDGRIRDTYAAASNATNKNGLYNSYIRAVRWASDRLGEKGGVVAFVTNAGWIDGNATDGLRRCLVEEFSSLYVFHLRGDQRTSGELSRREGGKIFGSGSRAPIAISVLVRKPGDVGSGSIYFCDIGDYLSREEKLDTIEQFHSIGAMSSANRWREIMPDKHGDWLNKRDQSFDAFLPIGTKRPDVSELIFERYSGGVKTQRDVWCYNSSRNELAASIGGSIEFFNAELERYHQCISDGDDDVAIVTNPARVSVTLGDG